MKGKKTGGRVAGTPNKVSSVVQDNVIAVFDDIGGKPAMAKWAKENQTEFYRLWGRLLPRQINSEVSTETNRPAIELSDGELMAMIGKNKLKAVK